MIQDEVTVWVNLLMANGESATSRNEVISKRMVSGLNSCPTGYCIQALATRIHHVFAYRFFLPHWIFVLNISNGYQRFATIESDLFAFSVFLFMELYSLIRVARSSSFFGCAIFLI